MKLWEILVPVRSNTSKEILVEDHWLWDAEVRKIVGGATIMRTVKGHWECDGKVVAERMIPVRVACTEEEMKRVVQLTIRYYKQKAVMYYVVSERCYIETRKRGRK